MGANNNVYVGCYLTLPIKNEPSTESYYVNSRGKKKNSRFNPDTGEEYERKFITKNVKVEPRAYIEDVDGLDEDMFWAPEYIDEPKNKVIFLLNGGKFSKDFDEVKTICLSDIDIQKILLEFRREYSKYINYYVEQYGEVECNYGVVHYAH